MYPVTEAYNTQMEKTVRNKSWIRITFGVTDPDAPAASTLVDNGHLPWSNVQGTVVGASSPATYATLEHNRWILDGKNPIPVTDNPIYQGYCGTLISGSDGVWSTNPQITITLDDYFEFAGLSFYFDDSMEEYPALFQVQAYYDDTLVHDETDSPTKAYWIHNYKIPICNKLVFTWLKSNRPYRRARMTSMIFGILDELTEGDITSCTSTREIDTLSTSFPKNNFDFVIFDTDKSYDPENPAGVWEYLESRQPVDVSIGYSLDDGTIEWIPWTHAYSSGDFSVSGSDAATLVTIKCVGLIEHLTMVYNSGQYYPEGRSLYDLAYDVINDAGFANVVEIDTALRDIVTTVPLPSDQANNLLQMIANAGRCVMNHTRGGVLQILREKTTDDDFSMNFSKILEKPETTKIAPLRFLSTVYHPVSVDSEVSAAISDQYIEVNSDADTTTYTLTNLIANGSFETNTDGWVLDSNQEWSLSSDIYAVGGKSVKITRTSTGYKSIYQNIAVDPTHKYYCSTMMYIENNGDSYYYAEIATYNSDGTLVAYLTVDDWDFNVQNTETGVWKRLNCYLESLSSSIVTAKIQPYRSYTSVSTEGIVYVDGVFFIDLTETFGAGNEPDKAWCDTHLSYFDGSIRISKDTYLLRNMIRGGDFESNTSPDGFSTNTNLSLGTLDVKFGSSYLWIPSMEQYIVRTYQNMKGHKYYLSFWESAYNENCNGVVTDSMSGGQHGLFIANRIAPFKQYTWNKRSIILSYETEDTFRCLIGTTYAGGVETSGSVDNVMLIDLTEAFGAGNEPTQEWCDTYIPYFNDVYVLPKSFENEIAFNHNAFINQTVETTGNLIAGEPTRYAYKTIVPLYGSGNITINGNALQFADVEYRKKYGDVGEDLTSMQNDLIDSYENCVAYADWLAWNVQRRNTYSAPDRGYPQLDVGDNIDFTSNFRNDVPVTITKQSVTFNGAITGDSTYLIRNEGDET